MQIALNEVEQRLAKFLAKQRHLANRKAGVQNRKIGSQSDELTDLEGIAAEIAFCKMMNVYPDLQLDQRPAEDAVLSNGHTVDIKATRYRKGRLVAVPWKKPKVDFFALMIGSFPCYQYAGSIPSLKMLDERNLKDLGHGDVFAVNQEELADFVDWLDGAKT